MWQQRWDDVLDGAVLIDVAGNTERCEITDLFGTPNRATEDQHRQPAGIQLANTAHQVEPLLSLTSKL